MRTTEGFIAPNMQDRKPKTHVAQGFQTAIAGMLGHDLRQSLQVIQATYGLPRSRLEEMPQRVWLDRGERAVTKLTEQLNCLVDAFYLAERDILIGYRRKGPEIRIDVYDTGIGIVEHQLLHIFESFTRLAPERSDGLGIGLSIVRRALEVLGHRIEVRSIVGEGSLFSIDAPAAAASAS